MKKNNLSTPKLVEESIITKQADDAAPTEPSYVRLEIFFLDNFLLLTGVSSIS